VITNPKENQMSLKSIAQIITESQSLQNIISHNQNGGEDLLTQVQHSLAKSSAKIRICKVMKNQIRILIPSTINIDVPCDTSNYVETVNELFSKCFGGTISKGFVGFYQSDDARLISESIFEVEAWMTEDELWQHLSQLADFIFRLLTELNQETVFFVINNVAALVEVADISHLNLKAA